MRRCAKCGYEISEDEPVYCDSCFTLLFNTLKKAQNKIKNLEQENYRLKNQLEILKLEKTKRRRNFPWQKRKLR